MKFVAMVCLLSVTVLLITTSTTMPQQQVTEPVATPQQPVTEPQENKPVTEPQENKPVTEPQENKPVVSPVRPKNPELDNGPVIADQATLPFNLVKNKLDNLSVGTTCYVAESAIRVDAKRKCWLHPLALTGAKSVERSIQIKRDTIGYHVILSSTDYQWEAEDLNTSAGIWIPVRSIAME